jgi:hypothetical protein
MDALMPGITRQRYNEIHEAAKALVASVGGVESLDAMDNLAARRSILVGLSKQLQTDEGLTYQTARGHIAKACRRLRHPDNWGGARANSGPRKQAE